MGRKPGEPLAKALELLSHNPGEVFSTSQISERIGVRVSVISQALVRMAKKETTGLRFAEPPVAGQVSKFVWVTDEGLPEELEEPLSQNGNGESKVTTKVADEMPHETPNSNSKSVQNRGLARVLRDYLRTHPNVAIGSRELLDHVVDSFPHATETAIMGSMHGVVKSNDEAQKLGTGLWIWNTEVQPEEKPKGQLKVVTRRGAKGIMVDEAGQLWRIEKLEW